MTSETTHKRRRTTMVPVTTIEELPSLDDQERAKLVASLKEAKAGIKVGKGAEYDPQKFKDRLVRIYRSKTH